jgi:hypothetical protein
MSITAPSIHALTAMPSLAPPRSAIPGANATGHIAAHGHRWISRSIHAVLRSLVVVIGIALIVVSLALDATIMLLPAGLALGCASAGIITWGITGDLFDE